MSMKTKITNKGWSGRLGTLVGISAILTSIPVMAQDVDTNQAGEESEDASMMEEVMVTGVRRSLELALNAKRDSDSIMDGIASEGIGKFPDLNLAEALSRVTGVQIDYSGPGGERREGQIAIRGLPNNFAKTQVNGQTLATPNFNGGFSYGTFESDVVGGVNVIKSPLAKYDEGGLSGIVDIRLLRPLDIRSTFLTIETEGRYEETADEWIPGISGSWARKFNDDSLGVFLSAKWTDQDFRTDSARINRYITEDTDGDGLADIYTPEEARYNSRTSEGDRFSASGGIEWQATDSVKLGLIGIYSSYELQNEFDQLRVQDGDVTGYNLLDGGKFGSTHTQAEWLNTEVDAESRVFDDEFYSWGLTGDVQWIINEDWLATGVLHYSDAGYDRFALQSRRNQRDRTGNGLDFYIDTGGNDHKRFSITPLNGDWADPAWYSYGDSVTNDTTGEWRQRLLSSTGTDRNETEKAVQIDLSRQFHDSFITSVEGGLKYREFERTQERPSWSISGWDFSGIDDLGVLVDNMGMGGDGFFGGDIKGANYYLVPYWKDVYNALLANNECTGECIRGLPYRINNNRTFETSTDISAAYLMAYFDFSQFDVPVRGNVGVRYVDTDRSTEAYTSSDLLEGGEQVSSADIDFDHTLPSLNVVWDIRDDLMLRGAVYKSMTRPDANQYRVDSSVDVNWYDDEETIPEEVDIELGNPYLMPFEADAFDLSLEWYHSEGSGISLAYFYKEVENGIEDRQLCPEDIYSLSQLDDFDFTGIITGGLSWVDEQCIDEAGVPVLIEDSINNKDKYDFSGWEFGILHHFDNLPAPWNGLGVRANFTFVDTDEGSETDASGNRLPLENVSENTYNASVYYDAPTWGVRMSYQYRSEYWLESTGSFTGEDRFVDDRWRLDLSGSWRFHDNWRVRAEIFNLTEEVRREYQGVSHRVRDLRWTGRVYTVSLRYRFR
jgi:TonB-dependent receptor